MKKDIPVKKVEDIAIAIVPRDGQLDSELWNVYLVNLKKDTLVNVLINSRGYGELDEEEIKTTTLRYFFEEIGPERAVLVEPIQTKLFDITNEYILSFQFEDYMYDKKYVFVKGSIDPMNFTNIPFIEVQGVMIK